LAASALSSSAIQLIVSDPSTRFVDDYERLLKRMAGVLVDGRTG
jgi:hypothetical protein